VKKIFFAVLLAVSTLYIFTAPPPAQAQTPPKFNLDSAKFEWDWSQGTGSPATEWHFKCGSASGNYAILTKLTYAAVPAGAKYSATAKQVLSIPGVYFCVNAASNSYGESGPTNEVNGDFGTVPTPGNDLVLKP